MLKLLIITSFICLFNIAFAQNRNLVDSAAANAVIEKSAQTFPKFYREYQYIKAHDTLIKKINLVSTDMPGGSPAFASPNGVITIDVAYLQSPKPNFDDNRLVVVLYHELGHLHYFVTVPKNNRNPDDSEKAAFEYSLLKTKELAAQGDCLPLKTGLKFMKLRSEGSNLQDPHVRALKRMVNEPVYSYYIDYVKAHCNDAGN